MSDIPIPDGFDEAWHMGTSDMLVAMFANKNEDGQPIPGEVFDQRQVFDEKFLPLILELVKLSQEHDIPIFAMTMFGRIKEEQEDKTVTADMYHIAAASLDSNRAALHQRAFASVMSNPPDWAIFPTMEALMKGALDDNLST